MTALRLRQTLAVFAAFVGFLTVVVVPPAEASTDEIEEAQRRADEATRAVSDAETALGEMDSKISDLEAQASAAERELALLGDSVEELVIEQYMSSGDVPLLTEEDLNQGVKAAAYSRYIGRDRLDQIDEYLQIKGELDDAATELTALRAEQERRLADLEDAVADVQAELERLEELERQRQAELERQRKEAEEKAAAEAAAKAEAEEARRSQQNRVTPQSETPDPTTTTQPSGPPPPVLHSGGGLVCPVAGAVSFIDSWGYSRSGGRRHKGVDMMARHGTPVVAPVSGVVTHRGNSVGGLSFHLDGDDGNYYYGTHLQGYANQGIGHVEAGTLIGYVGSSGNASAGAPHLHFEIHPNASSYSTAVNPYPATKAACG